MQRFGRVLHLIDRAGAARRPVRMRRLLERIAKSLGNVDAGVERDGEHGKLSAGCVSALDRVLADGHGRAERMARGL